MNTFTCPSREKIVSYIKDFWTEEHKCTYCGCIDPEKIIEAIVKEEEITFNSTEKAFYLGELKFDYKHCNPDQADIIRNYYDSKLMKIVTKY